MTVKQSLSLQSLKKRKTPLSVISQARLELLKRYATEVEKSDSTLFPTRYVKKREKYLKECQDAGFASDETWEDAMRHDPPLAMMKSLEKIKYICRTYQSDGNKTPLFQFIFPCSLSIPSERHYAYESLSSLSATMCLELSLNDQGKPLHVFIRPLNCDDGKEAELAGTMIKTNSSLNLSDMLVTSIKKSNPVEFSLENPIRTTSTSLEFYSPYGAHIKAVII